MAGFFDRMLGRGNKEGSGTVAKNRLQVVLVHDRINLPPERLRELKAELLAVIAKYVPIDHDSVDIAVEQPDRNSSRLVAQIPFGKGKMLHLPDDAREYTEDDDLEAVMKKLTDELPEVGAESATPEAASAETDTGAVGEEMTAASSASIVPDTAPDENEDTDKIE